MMIAKNKGGQMFFKGGHMFTIRMFRGNRHLCAFIGYI